MAWILKGDRQHCDRHDVTFSKAEVCSACNTDPGPPIEHVDQDDVDPAATSDERWCREQRDALMTMALGAAAEQPTQTAEQPAEPGTEGEALDGWFFWRGKWRPEKPPQERDVGLSTVAKLADTALKFHRAAVEERRRRGEKDHDRWLVKKARELKQIGVIN